MQLMKKLALLSLGVAILSSTPASALTWSKVKSSLSWSEIKSAVKANPGGYAAAGTITFVSVLSMALIVGCVGYELFAANARPQRLYQFQFPQGF